VGPSSSTRKRQTPGRCLGGRLSGGSRRPSVTNRSEHTFALRLLPRELPGPADRLGLLTRALFGRLLEMLPKLHFAEHAFALELLFQRAERLVDIVVADTDLHSGCHHLSGSSCINCRRWRYSKADIGCPHGRQKRTQRDMDDPSLKERLVDAALPHVAFDGWSPKTFRLAAEDAGIDRLKTAAFADLRFRDKVAEALWIRLEVVNDKEALRRAATLFALPHHAGDSAKAVWQTADAVWNALGDTSEDHNWYTKRATLSGVWAATVLYWLGDDSPGHQNTRAFIDRRIEEVMQIEKVKSRVRKTPIVGPLARGAENALSRIRAPASAPRPDLPGSWRPPVDGS